MKHKKGIITLAFVLVFSLLLSACADYEPPPPPEEYEVTVYLEYQKVALTTNSEVNVYVDDIKLGRQSAGTNRTYTVSLEAGEHRFYLRNDGIWKSDAVIFDVPEQDSSFSFGTKTRLTFGMEVWMNQEETTAAQGQNNSSQATSAWPSLDTVSRPQGDPTGSESAENLYIGETVSIAEKLLNSMQYTGDSSACAMSAAQARTFATVLRNTSYPVVKAALFDGGNGIPLLWVAHADREDYSARIADFSLDGNYDDQIYAFSNGSIVECAWMTTVLRMGENGVIVQAWTPYESEFGQSFNMYHMTNGLISDTPFATGSSDIDGSYLNG